MNYSVIDGKVVNENGDVAVAYYTTVPHTVRVGGVTYAFTVARNICMAWIKPEHVGGVLALMHRCCGSNYAVAYRLQNIGNTNRWLGVSER